ncbi:MAG: hypothetical protein F4Y84_12030 [Caldilineaceae bacterium SB0665_bin_25]|nr:hypothetical protein [Caldilineaceae bacterium SB0665_bin_25]
MTMASSNEGAIPVDVGSRLELMVDDYLAARLGGGARRRLNSPVPREIAVRLDAPWEGNASGGFTVFEDEGRYRMYYRGQNFVYGGKELGTPGGKYICYAKSADGIHWEMPELGLVEFNGSKKNNILLDAGEILNGMFSPFKDGNPACPAEARYKAFALMQRGHARGLWAYGSPDGIQWSRMSDGPVITKGLLDTQNLAFWDGERGEYRAYHRNEFRLPQTGEEPYGAHPVRSRAGADRTESQGASGRGGSGLRGSRYGRDILTATSSDFIHWTDSVYVSYNEGRPSELYSNQVTPYFRAPHLFLGFPTRYVERGWSEELEALPEVEHRRMRAAISERYGTALTDGMFMNSRDGYNFNLWPESFIRPGLRPRGNWTYGDNFQNWGIVTTPSASAGAPAELSFYLREGYWRDGVSALRRYTMRIDGFASVQAPLEGGELVTKPLVFAGRELVLNFSASAAGSVRVELLRDQMNIPVEGYSLEECVEALGDDLERVVRWKDGRELAGLAGTPIRLRFVLSDADLYSFRFRE